MSSVISFDIYGTYINKKPTNKQLIRWSHIGVVFSALFVSTLATAFHEGSINFTWLLYMLGIISCPGVFPTCFALLWSRQTKAAAITAPIVGAACGLAVWLGTAYHYYGEITIDSTGGTMPCLFGVVTSFVVPLPISVAISLARPEVFDFSVFNRIERVKNEHGESVKDREDEANYFSPERVKYMKRMSRWAAFWAVFTLTGHVLLWPLPMYGAKMTFSKSVSSLHSRSNWLADYIVLHRLGGHFLDLALVDPPRRQLLPADRRRPPADLDRGPRQKGCQGLDRDRRRRFASRHHDTAIRGGDGGAKILKNCGARAAWEGEMTNR
jgi:hypothetical protein